MTGYLSLNKVKFSLFLLLGTCTALFPRCSCANKEYKPSRLQPPAAPAIAPESASEEALKLTSEAPSNMPRELAAAKIQNAWRGFRARQAKRSAVGSQTSSAVPNPASTNHASGGPLHIQANTVDAIASVEASSDIPQMNASQPASESSALRTNSGGHHTEQSTSDSAAAKIQNAWRGFRARQAKRPAAGSQTSSAVPNPALTNHASGGPLHTQAETGADRLQTPATSESGGSSHASFDAIASVEALSDTLQPTEEHLKENSSQSVSESEPLASGTTSCDSPTRQSTLDDSALADRSGRLNEQEVPNPALTNHASGGPLHTQTNTADAIASVETLGDIPQMNVSQSASESSALRTNSGGHHTEQSTSDSAAAKIQAAWRGFRARQAKRPAAGSQMSSAVPDPALTNHVSGDALHTQAETGADRSQTPATSESGGSSHASFDAIASVEALSDTLQPTEEHSRGDSALADRSGKLNEEEMLEEKLKEIEELRKLKEKKGLGVIAVEKRIEEIKRKLGLESNHQKSRIYQPLADIVNDLEERVKKRIQEIKVERELEQICKDLRRGVQLTIDGQCIDGQEPDSEAKVKQQLRELIPQEKRAQIFPLLHQGLVGAALDHVCEVKIPGDSLSKAIVDKDVVLLHATDPISIELDTEQRQVTLTFSQEVYGTICLEDGKFEEKLMNPEANLGTLKISFTIPVEGVEPKQGERDMIVDELPPGTTYQLLPQDQLESAFSEYTALDRSKDGGIWQWAKSGAGQLWQYIRRSSSTIPAGGQDGAVADRGYEEINKEEVTKEMLKNGQSVLKNIYENSEPRFENQTAIIQLMNFLYEKAHEKGQAFDEGTYVLADPNKKLFQALSKFEGTYQRRSSHTLGEKESQSLHYGIDLPESTIRPLDKQHILFFSFKGQDGQQKLFLKPENYGVKDPRDALFHALEYVESLARRAELITPERGQQIHRKERVKYLRGEEQKIVQDFTEYIASSPNQEKETVDHIQKQVNDWGIAYIWLWLNTHANQVRNDKTLSNISDRLKAKFDHLACRTASEVIFSHDELMQGYAESSVDEAAQ